MNLHTIEERQENHQYTIYEDIHKENAALMLIQRNWTQLNTAVLIICFSRNAPIEITISEVCIDHSNVDRTLFSIDNNNRKGDGRTIKAEQFNSQEIDARSAILLGYHFQSFWLKSSSNTHQLTACTSNAIWSRMTCIFGLHSK